MIIMCLLVRCSRSHILFSPNEKVIQRDSLQDLLVYDRLPSMLPMQFCYSWHYAHPKSKLFQFEPLYRFALSCFIIGDPDPHPWRRILGRSVLPILI